MEIALPHAMIEVAINLLAAWGAGSMVGLERTFNGRVAGFRTHGIVALAAAAAMTISFAPEFAPGAFSEAHRVDPTRLAQGIMTGVGFLGAGVIFKEGVSVQGLTTAASIWGTAAIGLLCGLGMLAPAGLTAVMMLIILTVLRKVESALPAQVYALASLRFRSEGAPRHEDLRRLLGEHSISLAETSFHLSDEGRMFEFRGSLQARRDAAFEELAERLRKWPGLVEFQLDRVSK